MSHVDVNKRFGLVIKTWRRKFGISQEELAWRAGLHRTYVADIERGARNPSLQSIHKIAKALKVSFSALFEPFGEFPGPAKNGRVDQEADILLIGNHPGETEFTLEAFRSAHVKNPIHVANDGAEALKYMFGPTPNSREPLKHHPRLILLDLNTSRLGGLEVLRRIKEDERSRSIPVVALSGSPTSRECLEAQRLGAEVCVAKPIDFHRFSKLVPKLNGFWRLFLPNG